MPLVQQCLNGHQWEADTAGSNSCPICGATGTSVPPAGMAPSMQGTAGASASEQPTAAPLLASEQPTAARKPRAGAGELVIPGYEILAQLGRGGIDVGRSG